jgi:hypothetical protein
MRLCFGTFLAVLEYCGRKKLIVRKLIECLTLTIDKDSYFSGKHKSVRSTCSRLRWCKSNFAYGSGKGDVTREGEEAPRESLTKIWELSGGLNTEDISPNFKNVLSLISEDKKATAILALLDIIAKDTEIDKSHRASFEKFVGVKEELLMRRKFILSDFLAGILLYTVREIDNKVGIDCILDITPEYVDAVGLANGRRIQVVDFPVVSKENDGIKVFKTDCSSSVSGSQVIMTDEETRRNLDIMRKIPGAASVIDFIFGKK